MLTLRTDTGSPVPYPKPAGPATFNETTGEGVSWAGWTWNPITGCKHSCTYCYARSISTRFTSAFPAGFEPLFHEERLPAPSTTKIPRKHRSDPAYERVFVCSMADMWGRWVPRPWIEQILAVERAAPQWVYLHLTKFPDRYLEFVDDLPPNSWAGTSIDEQVRVRIAMRAMEKLAGRVELPWLSLEPLEADLDIPDLSMFGWVVIGARTATVQPGGYMPAFNPPASWVLRLTDQARQDGVPVHWKPNLRKSMEGIAAPGDPDRFDEYPTGMRRLAA